MAVLSLGHWCKTAAATLVAMSLGAGLSFGQAGQKKDAVKPPAPKAKELVALLDFDRTGASKSQAAAVSNQLRAELLKGGQVTLVDRGKMDTLLNEQAFQQTGCTSQECAVQAGKILGVRKIVSGSITKADEKLWQLAAQMVDVESGEVVMAETLNHDGDYRSLLLTGVPALAAKLVAPRAADGTPLAPPLKLAIFPCYFRLNNPTPPMWQQEHLRIGLDAIKSKVPHTVGFTFYPQFTSGQPITDTSGLESGSWSMLGNPNEKFIAGKAAQWGMDAALVVRTVVNGDRMTITAFVIDAKTQRIA
ncbi:MAG TPA: DUF2380 domain-containing protein, partial [bacterium]